MISLTEDRRMLGYESLSSYPNISHFVTTRHGGCGEGAYGSFNCSPYCGDDAEVVRRNQELLIEGMSHKPVALVIPRQVHGTDCMLVQDLFWSWPPDRWGPLLDGIDALITNVPGYCLCISTADCVPVLLYDQKRQAVAAIHAGWRGTAGLIVRNVLQHMMEKFGTQPEDVVATIGPSISQASFEVGRDVYKAFRRRGFDMSIISYKMKRRGNIISTCGKRTGGNYSNLVCLKRILKWRESVRISIRKSFSRQDDWVLIPDGYYRES